MSSPIRPNSPIRPSSPPCTPLERAVRKFYDTPPKERRPVPLSHPMAQLGSGCNPDNWVAYLKKAI